MIETTSIDIIPSNFVFTFMCRFPFLHEVMAEIKYIQACDSNSFTLMPIISTRVIKFYSDVFT